MITINATGDTTIHTANKYCSEDILVKVPASGSGGASVKTCTLEIVDDDWNRVYLAYQDVTGENKVYDDTEGLGMVEIPTTCTVKRGSWVVLGGMTMQVTTTDCEVFSSIYSGSFNTYLIHISGNTPVITLT